MVTARGDRQSHWKAEPARVPPVLKKPILAKGFPMDRIKVKGIKAILGAAAGVWEDVLGSLGSRSNSLAVYDPA